MARTEQWFGLGGLAFLSGLLEIALLVALYVVARRRADAWSAMPVTAVALWTMQYGLSMRPQVVSYLLVAVVTGAWLQTSDDHRVRWWLVPLVWLWAMLHGMWPVGLAISGVTVVGLALDRAPLPVVARAAGVTLASAVAAALTPIGPPLYGAIAAVGSRRSYFVEWQQPTLVSWEALGLTVLVVATLVGWWRRGSLSWTEVVLLVLAVGLAVWSRRTVPVAAAMLTPLAAGALQGLAGRRTPVDRRERRTVAVAVILAVVALAVAVPFTSADPPEQPSWVDPALSALPAGTKVLDDWAYGGYLMWRHPQLDLMMHGYGDTFTTAELDRNQRLLALGPGWENDLRESGARVAVLRPSSAVRRARRSGALGRRALLARPGDAPGAHRLVGSVAPGGAGLRLSRLRQRPSGRGRPGPGRSRRPRSHGTGRPAAPPLPARRGRRRPRARPPR